MPIVVEPSPAPPPAPVAPVDRPWFGRIPKMRVPHRLENGHLAVCEQGSPENIAANVYTVLSYERGSRVEDPDFGVEDPTFSEMPLDDREWLEQIGVYEPRAAVTTTQEARDLIGDVLVEVRKGL